MNYFEHFKIKELFETCSEKEISQCIFNGSFDNLLVLLQVLDGVRDYSNSAIIITSSYRDFEHNKRVGGVSTSQHLLGQAIDFKFPNISFGLAKFYVREFFKKSALKNFIGQVIFYNQRKFIHIGLCTSSHPKTQFYEYEQRDN